MVFSDRFIRLNFTRMTPEEQTRRVETFTKTMQSRRSVRSFSNQPVSERVMEKVIQTAGTAPSGANQQPWRYIVIKDPEIKRAIRQAAEKEEAERLVKSEKNPGAYTYNALGDKAYLEEAPYLVALFRIKWGINPDSKKKIKHYYVNDSTAISAGFFLSALQHVGLDSLTHVRVEASQSLLNRPENEAPFLLFAVGYAKDGYKAPTLIRKPLSAVVIGDVPKDKKTPHKAPDYVSRPILHEDEQYQRAEAYYQFMKKRRNVRDFSTEPVDRSLIYSALEAASTTPYGGAVQPYRFAIVNDIETKKIMREHAEIEEKKLYEEKISDEWRDALAPLGTNWMKPHLTDAPYQIIAFKVQEDPSRTELIDGSQLYSHNPYTMVSAGMAVGIFLSAIHHAGLCTLTHTPNPMNFLRDLLNRPKTETPFIVMPVGYPVDNCEVPDIGKKPLEEILIWKRGDGSSASIYV